MPTSNFLEAYDKEVYPGLSLRKRHSSRSVTVRLKKLGKSQSFHRVRKGLHLKRSVSYALVTPIGYCRTTLARLRTLQGASERAHHRDNEFSDVLGRTIYYTIGLYA